MEWVLNALFIPPSWWCGLQYDKAKYFAKELKKKEEEVNKLLVKQLEDTEQRFKSLFFYNTDPIFTLDLSGRVIDANQATEKLSGYTKEELKQKKWEDIILPEYLNRHKSYYRKVKKGYPQEFTIAIEHRDGRKRDILVKMIPITSDNHFIGTYEIAKDITESKLAEEMIRRSEKLSAVGQLAAGVAHEIRNPLTTLRGFIQLLISDKEKEYGEIMLTEIDRINQIVSEFLILSKPQVISFEQKNIIEILDNIISLLQAQANYKNIQIIKDYEIDYLAIKCEPNQLKQVFINLLKNAIEAMPDGGEIIVRMKTLDLGLVCISIIDQGIGIAEDQIPKLGEPFHTTKEDGTGLGLMVCFRIVENHGGKMEICSQLNKGTCVEVSLPANGR